MARDKRVLFEAFCSDGEEDTLEALLREAAAKSGYVVRRTENLQPA